jgi:hypothetical protein
MKRVTLPLTAGGLPKEQARNRRTNRRVTHNDSKITNKGGIDEWKKGFMQFLTGSTCF